MNRDNRLRVPLRRLHLRSREALDAWGVDVSQSGGRCYIAFRPGEGGERPFLDSALARRGGAGGVRAGRARMSRTRR